MGDDPTPATSQPAATDLPLILPGGKVDPEAIRALYERLRSAGSNRAGPDRDGSDHDGAAEDASEDGDDTLPVVTFVLQRDLLARLDKYLTTRITFMSRTQLQRLIDAGSVLVNGQPGKASTKLRLGDEVSVTLPPPPSSAVVPEDIALDVLHEDEHLIVLNKHAGIIVHPARSEGSGTMINALAYHFRHRSDGALSEVGKELARPGVVHRLDRDTTGCIVFAKTEEAHWKIASQFEHRTADKRYLAVVRGRVEPGVQVIDLPLGPHQSREKGYREKHVVRHDHMGKASVTICRVREAYRFHDRPVGDQEFTLVELELKTGRTHQIRVHLSHSGWPIVGDAMYGGRPFELPADDDSSGTPVLIERQMLHAAMLTIAHPVTGEPLTISASPPEDMQALLAVLRRGLVASTDAEPTPGIMPDERVGLGRRG